MGASIRPLLMIGWISLAGKKIPVYKRTWITIPPSAKVDPADLLVCAQSTLYVPALEPLPVEDLVRWAALRGLTDYRCNDPDLQQTLLAVLRRDYDAPPVGILRAAPATAGSLHPGPAEAALEAYVGPSHLDAAEVLVAPEPGAQVEIALTSAPLRASGHLCVLHYRPPMMPQAWLELPYTDEPSVLCAAFGDSKAFDAVYSYYESRGDLV